MKKYIVGLLFLVLFLFSVHPVSSFADSVGSQGDLTFIDDEPKSSEMSQSFTQKPASVLHFPNTGEKAHFLWIISGTIIGLFSLYLIIIKQQFRRK
jgi:uncharacterized membrane protein SpoIIM required for sporulation